jgi:hypothetical protein
MNNTVNDQEYFWTNVGVHSAHTKNMCHPQRPVAYLSRFWKSTLCAGDRILNILSSILIKKKKLSLKFR